MQLLKWEENSYQGQADPFILKSGGRYYIYVTGHDAIYISLRMPVGGDPQIAETVLCHYTCIYGDCSDQQVIHRISFKKCKKF